jgi:Holliday junction resolvasome RuvABC DNA-binding subunit
MGRAKPSIMDTSVADVLASDRDANTKVQAIVKLGYDDDAADEIVEHYQMGQNMLNYYERLYYFEDPHPEASED